MLKQSLSYALISDKKYDKLARMQTMHKIFPVIRTDKSKGDTFLKVYSFLHIKIIMLYATAMSNKKIAKDENTQKKG